jgi:flagellar basal-body rod protein FlgC
MTLPPITSTPSIPTPPARPNAPQPMFSTLAISASGLSAQRMRMEVIAQNLANAETTHTAQGGPYQRRIVNLEAVAPQDGTITSTSTSTSTSASATTSATATAAAASVAGMSPSTGAIPDAGDVTGDVTGGVRVASVSEDTTPGAMIYDPGHPDADKNGYVHMPNVSITDEMMDLMNARRLYEANATVFQVARAMLHKSIDI